MGETTIKIYGSFFVKGLDKHIVQQEENDLRRRVSFEQEIEELQQSASSILDMLQDVGTERDLTQQTTERIADPEQTNTSTTQQSDSTLAKNSGEDIHADRNKHSYKYRSTTPCLVEALDWIALYFQRIQTPPAKPQIAPEYQPGVVEKEDWLTRCFRELQNQPRKPEARPETRTSGPKPILRNKTAVQTEEIWRTLDLSDEKKLEEITESNTFIVDLEEEDSPQKNRTRPGSRNRKGITIQEEANTVREIPKDNIGTIITGTINGKRYSEEPSWLDRYMSEDADEEFLEAFLATTNNEMDRVIPRK